jgi:predicted anti-sigma-YlaC factor YlaD
MAKLERHYRFHLRRMAVGLAFSLALGVATIFALLRPGLGVGVVVAPALVFLAATLGLNIALRGRGWARPDVEDRRIGRDEWVGTNINRAHRVALLAVYAAQVPLMLLVVHAPPDPAVSASVVAMALLTMSSGGAAFFTSYLLASRQQTDG